MNFEKKCRIFYNMPWKNVLSCSVYLMRPVHTCPRLGFPHFLHIFFDSLPCIRILRALSSRIHLLRIDDRVRPGNFWVMRFHFCPEVRTRSMIAVSSSKLHDFIFGRRPPLFFLTRSVVDDWGALDDGAFEDSGLFESWLWRGAPGEVKKLFCL